MEKLVDTMLVLNDGRPVFYGPPAALLDEERRLEICIEGKLEIAIDVLRQQGIDAETDGSGRLFLPPGSIRLTEAITLFRKRGLKLIAFHETQPRLEDAYVRQLPGSAAFPRHQGKR
jgi:ABC-type uncharacterized transport system ATPase subunit